MRSNLTLLVTARLVAGLDQHAARTFDHQSKERNQFAFNVLDHEMDRYLFLEVPSEMRVGDVLGSICRMLALLLGLVCILFYTFQLANKEFNLVFKACWSSAWKIMSELLLECTNAPLQRKLMASETESHPSNNQCLEAILWALLAPNYTRDSTCWGDEQQHNGRWSLDFISVTLLAEHGEDALSRSIHHEMCWWCMRHLSTNILEVSHRIPFGKYQDFITWLGVTILDTCHGESTQDSLGKIKLDTRSLEAGHWNHYRLKLEEGQGGELGILGPTGFVAWGDKEKPTKTWWGAGRLPKTDVFVKFS